MKTGRSLQDWAKEIERRANAKRDFMVDTRSMEMFNGEQGPQVSLELQDSRLQLGMTENAHRQIGTHLNIPAKYYELMRKENPELLVQNVNSWLEKNPTRRLVRALDGDMRAFLSDRYRCIDNLDIAECVLPIISKIRYAERIRHLEGELQATSAKYREMANMMAYWRSRCIAYEKMLVERSRKAGAEK